MTLLTIGLLACSDPTTWDPEATEPGPTEEQTSTESETEDPGTTGSTDTEVDTGGGTGEIEDPWEPLPALPPLAERRCDGLAAATTYDPATWGPHPVGVRTIELTDPTRADRTLLTEVWYPADESVRGWPGESYGLGLDEVAMMAGDDSGALAALMLLLLGDADLLTLVETSAVREAPPAAHDPDRGLVLFSHGYRGIRYQSTFLTTYLASHGYVVAAPDHVGNTMFDGTASDDESVVNRIHDMAFVSSELRRLSTDPQSALYEAFDTDRVGWTGHSFGASTVLMAGAMDNQELVGVSLAPMFDDRMTGVHAPESYEVRGALTLVGGTEDTTCEWSHQQLAYDRTSSPRFLAQLDGARHFDFTDLCANDLFRYGVTAFVEELNDACGADPTAYHAAIQTLTTATLNRYLACDPDAAADLVDPAVDHLAGWWADPAGDIAASDHPLQPPWTTAPEAPVETWEVDVSGTTVLVQRHGPAEGRALVLVPDAGFDGAVWWPQVDALASSSPVVVLESASPEVVETVIQTLALEDAVVVGWGAGGQAALDVATRLELGGLVLVGTAPSVTTTWAEVADYNGGLTLTHARHLEETAERGWRPVVADLLAGGGDPDHVSWLEERLDPAAIAAGPEVLDRLDQVGEPVLVIHGEQDDAVLLESGRYLERTLPDARLEVFQRSGHVPFAEEPEAFAQAVLEFVASR